MPFRRVTLPQRFLDPPHSARLMLRIGGAGESTKRLAPPGQCGLKQALEFINAKEPVKVPLTPIRLGKRERRPQALSPVFP